MGFERMADAGRMRKNEVALEIEHTIVGYVDLFKFAEAGTDAVDGELFGDDEINSVSRLDDELFLSGMDFDGKVEIAK